MSTRPWLWGLCLAASLVWSSPALAKPVIVVLAFGGEQGVEVRDVLVKALGKKYDVLEGQMLLDACDQLGITMSRGKNLATAASHLGAVAVVGGTMKDAHLVLAVYSSKTGQPLATGSVAMPDVNRASLGKALAMILKGLKKAPKKVNRPGPAPQPVALPEPRPKNGGKVAGGSGKAGGGGEVTGGSIAYDPNAPDAGGVGGAAAAGNPAGAGGSSGGSGAEENPLEPTRRPPPVAAPPPVVRAPGVPHPPRIQGLLGFGSWIRSFNMFDAVGPPAPKYSGSAFTLRIDARVYPVAFFLESWPAGFVLTLQYQQALGFSSASKQATTSGTVDVSFGTTMRQLLFGAGYDWKILPSRALSPQLELTLGYGLMDFEINWGDDPTTQKNLPAIGYRFFVANLGFRYPFLSWLGAFFNFDYRAVSGSGEIEDDSLWYGASKTGGINFSLGAFGGWKGITAVAEYGYTRYFYAFENPEPRVTAGQTDPNLHIAGGALDIMHTLMISVGYKW